MDNDLLSPAASQFLTSLSKEDRKRILDKLNEEAAAPEKPVELTLEELPAEGYLAITIILRNILLIKTEISSIQVNYFRFLRKSYVEHFITHREAVIKSRSDQIDGLRSQAQQASLTRHIRAAPPQQYLDQIFPLQKRLDDLEAHSEMADKTFDEFCKILENDLDMRPKSSNSDYLTYTNSLADLLELLVKHFYSAMKNGSNCDFKNLKLIFYGEQEYKGDI
jgi:vacuolar-type H+-ATPase subunit I/STV1